MRRATRLLGHVQRLGDVRRRRAVHEHRQERQVVGVDAVRGGVELGAAQRRERALATGHEPDGLEELGRRLPALVDQPVGADDAGEELDLVVGQRRVHDDARARPRGLEAAAEADAVAVAQMVLEQEHVGPLAGQELRRVGETGSASHGDQTRFVAQ